MSFTEKMRDLIRNHRYLNIALPIALFTMIAVAMFSSWSIYQLREAIRYERQSNFIQANVHNVYQLIQGAESSQRGYLLTGKTEYLATYMTSFPEIPKAVEQLKHSVSFLPAHEAQLNELDELLAKKLDELKLTVVLQQAEKEDDALALIQTDRGEALMNRIHAVLDGIDRDARKEAAVHQTFVRRYASVLNLTIGVGTATTLLLVLLFAFFTREEILQRRRSEQELRAAQDAALIASKAKSQFLATVSHEIRTPLNGIIGMSDLLRARVKDPEHRRFVDIIHNSGNVLLKIVNEILDFSKIEAGRIDFEFSDFSLIEAVEGTLELYSAQAREKKLSLVSYVDPALSIRVVGDSSRISQILRNLISNAIKFTDHGGVTVRVRVTSRLAEKSFVRFEVSDTGPGIKPEHHRSLFQPFNQIAEAGSRREGTGLGLSICKDLSEAMGGTVGFESSPGRGSTFWAEIPLKTSSTDLVGSIVVSPPPAIFFVGQEEALERVLGLYASEWNFSIQPLPADVPERSVIFVSLNSALESEMIARLKSLEKRARLVFISRDSLDDLSPQIREIQAEGLLGEPFRRDQLSSVLNGVSSFVAAQPAAVMPAPPVEKTSSGLILLVEDNPTNQLLAELLLAELGHRTHTVANGREAVEALSRISYDVVLMDCQMPVMDGFEATRLIREREATTGQHTPIVAMTANALDSDREKCLAAGMDDFIAKPFQALDLSAKLQRWVSVTARGAVDWAVLRDLGAKTNNTVVTRLIQSFLKTLPASLGEIRKAQAAHDSQSLRAWAHQLKSSGASLGALELHALCVRVEDAVDSKVAQGVLDAAVNDLLVNGEAVFKEFQAQTRYV